MMVDHAETAHLDTPKERALRLDYDNADIEISFLKAELKRVRMIPLPEEVTAMFYWRRRAHDAEAMLKKFGLTERYETLAQEIEAQGGKKDKDDG